MGTTVKIIVAAGLTREKVGGDSEVGFFLSTESKTKDL